MSRPETAVNEIVAKMQECGLGMRRKTVEISAYKALWVSAFLWLKNRIEGHLGNADAYRIEHFGSTSIPNIAAKPALDVMVIFTSRLDLEASIPRLEELGFIYKGDAVGGLGQTEPDSERHFFSFYGLDECVDYIHLHVFLDGHHDVTRSLKFRDILRENTSLVERYEQLKLQLKDQGMTRHEYTRAKDVFISRVVLEIE